jgi:hypothetical protein
MVEYKLKPCPFCGGDMLEIDSKRTSTERRVDTEKEIRNEAIKEFAERLKNTIFKLEGNSLNKVYETAMNDMLFYYMPKIIDDVVEEMTEG